MEKTSTLEVFQASNEIDEKALKLIIRQTKTLLERIPQYKENIERHNNSLEKTSKIIRRASNEANHNSGSVAFFSPSHRATLLMKELNQLLYTVGSNDLTEEKLLPYVTKYQEFSKELTSMGFASSRVVTNPILEKGYQLFEHSLNYFEDYQLINSLIEALDMLIRRYSVLLTKLQDFYKNNQEDEDSKPQVYDLVKDMGNMKRSFPKSEYEYIESIKKKLPDWLQEEIFSQLLQRFKDLAPAYHEYYSDQILKLVGSENAINNLIGNQYKDFQESIDSAKNMAQVRSIAIKLDVSVEKLYLFHWIYETFFKWVYRNKKKRKVLGYKPAQWFYEPTIGKALNSFMNSRAMQHNKHDSEVLENFLKEGVYFRNRVAHQGIIHDPTGFNRAINAYETGGELSVKLFESSLTNVPKVLSRVYNPEKAKEAMISFLDYKSQPHENFNEVNGFRNAPETQLTYADLKRNDYLRKVTFESEKFTSYYDVPASQIDATYGVEFMGVLAQNFSRLLFGKGMPYVELRDLCRKSMVAAGVIEEGDNLPGLTRALFMAAKAKDASDSILDQKAYSPRRSDSKTIREIANLIKNYTGDSNE